MVEPSVPPPEDSADGDKKRLFERAIPEILRKIAERALEVGAERLAEGPDQLRQKVGELKLPKEVLSYLYTQIDETKLGIYRAAAKEIRDVLEHTNFVEDITKILTKLSFEVKTEVRFIPNAARESREEGRTSGYPKPEVVAEFKFRDQNRDQTKESP